ncbi:HDOD domain-containing protein [Leeia oryzae]|uniref:HDOD domain-containing protein n=1 Tax=Leeia oryzae TaxID=356662 RepID=UPI0004756D4E|nr:HDOD domain-containing protein [Leeia oryzae]
MSTMDTYISEQNGLPSSEHVIMELIRKIDDTEVALDTLVHQIGNDTVLSARLLKLANSSFFGMSSKIGSIQSAVLVLGLANVKKLAISVSFLNTKGASPILIDFWRRNLLIAYCADWLAHKTGHPQDICFVGGLLHDIGMLLLYSKDPESFSQLVHDQQCGMELIIKEKEILGFDHTELGAMLAKQWHFPEDIIQSIRCHHTSQAATISHIALIVYCADELVNLYKSITASENTEINTSIPADLIQYLGLAPEQLSDWIIELEKMANGVDSILLE